MATRTRKVENTNEGYKAATESRRNGFSPFDGSLTKMAGWPVEIWLRCQLGMLNTVEPAASGWIERRREAAAAALDTIERLNGCSDFEEIASIQHRWFEGAMKRLDSDLHAIADHALMLSHEGVSATRYAAQTSSDVVAFAVHAGPRREDEADEAA